MLAVGHAQSRSKVKVSRRDFLRCGGLGVLGLSVAEQAALKQARAGSAGTEWRSCIFLFLTGGPSQFETFDPKPEAPLAVRGPFRPIATSVPGIQLSETLPALAQRADRFSLLRSMWHDAAPIHETGQQLMQTGRLAQRGIVSPSFGSVVAQVQGAVNELPPYVVLPRVLQNSGVYTNHGQQAGSLGTSFDPFVIDPASLRSRDSLSAAAGSQHPAFDIDQETVATHRRYGETDFGRACLLARRMVEQGVRFVTVNMYDSLVNSVTWDCHANGHGAPSRLQDYRDTVCPAFDRACSALLDDLSDRGLLERTLVVATGEFGRTPRVNDLGGRDHWPGVWSALVAGGGTRGGQVIGSSDSRGSAPAERPVEPAELAATIYHSLGIDGRTQLNLANGGTLPLADRPPIAELFA